MLSIDEAIEKNRKIAEMKKTIYDACILEEYNRHLLREYKEHEQLAEWLEELKCYKNDNDFSDYAERLHKIAFNSGYNKAIDDFTEKIKENISESLIWGMIADCFKYKNMNDTSDKIVDYVINTSNEIAEQLKAGGKNE